MDVERDDGLAIGSAVFDYFGARHTQPSGAECSAGRAHPKHAATCEGGLVIADLVQTGFDLRAQCGRQFGFDFAGAAAFVFDVKFGHGAIMKDAKESRALAELLNALAAHAGKGSVFQFTLPVASEGD